MYELLPLLRLREFDDDGNPLAGGKLYSYVAGTSTLSTTYADANGETPNSNPIVLDANGRATTQIYLGSGNYKFILTDSDDNVLKTDDDISGSPDNTPSGWSEHEITAGQGATSLEGETLDLDDYSSAFYDVCIVRGTTVVANGPIAIQGVNGTGRVLTGVFLTLGGNHGVTFTVTQDGTVVQLQAAVASDGKGSGTIHMSRRLVPTS